MGIGGVAVVPLLLFAGLQPHLAVYVAQGSFVVVSLLNTLLYYPILPKKECARLLVGTSPAAMAGIIAVSYCSPEDTPCHP